MPKWAAELEPNLGLTFSHWTELCEIQAQVQRFIFGVYVYVTLVAPNHIKYQILYQSFNKFNKTNVDR